MKVHNNLFYLLVNIVNGIWIR